MKKSKSLLISSILGTLYLFFLIYNFIGNILNFDTFTNAIVTSILAFLIIPHIFLLILALIFNIIGFVANLRWCALVSGIFYCISILAMPLLFIFLIPSIAFSFHAFSKMRSYGFIETNIFIQK